MRGSAALPLALALAACGKAAPLEPSAGASMPVAPYGARATPSAETLMTPPAQTRPARSDELRSSRDRREDAFDLPPPD